MSTFLYYSDLHQESTRAVNVLKDCLIVFFPIFMLKKYSPYTNQVNKIIDRMFRAGLIKHWTSDYIFEVPNESYPIVRLSLEKLKGIFFFLLGGLLLSMLAFGGEWVCFFMFEKRKRIIWEKRGKIVWQRKTFWMKNFWGVYCEKILYFFYLVYSRSKMSIALIMENFRRYRAQEGDEIPS